VSPHHPTRGSTPAGSGAEPQPKIDFMHILSQKEANWNTIFSIFERRRAPLTSRGPEKLPPFPLSTGLQAYTDVGVRWQVGE